jgi:hypothetical protein
VRKVIKIIRYSILKQKHEKGDCDWKNLTAKTAKFWRKDRKALKSPGGKTFASFAKTLRPLRLKNLKSSVLTILQRRQLILP